MAGILSASADVKGRTARVSPSVLACDLADLTREVERLADGREMKEGDAPQWVHIDVMDG